MNGRTYTPLIIADEEIFLIRLINCMLFKQEPRQANRESKRATNHPTRQSFVIVFSVITRGGTYGGPGGRAYPSGEADGAVGRRSVAGRVDGWVAWHYVCRAHVCTAAAETTTTTAQFLHPSSSSSSSRPTGRQRQLPSRRNRRHEPYRNEKKLRDKRNDREGYDETEYDAEL